MTGWGVRIGLDLSVDVEKISGDLLDWLYNKTIGCRVVQMVSIPADRFGRDDVIMMVDEEGMLREDPQTNLIASILYGYRIVGNAVLMRIGTTEDGDMDWMGFKDWSEAVEICMHTYYAAIAAITNMEGDDGHEEGEE